MRHNWSSELEIFDGTCPLSEEVARGTLMRLPPEDLPTPSKREIRW